MAATRKRPTLRAFSADLGITHPYLVRLRKASWWPRGALEWDLDACGTAIAANVRGRRGSPAGATATRAATAPSAVPAPDDVLEGLRGGGDAVELADAAMRLAIWRMMKNAETGLAGSRDFDDLKKAMTERRVAKTQQREEDEAAGRLVPREDVAAAGGALARRFVVCLDALEVRLEARVEEWFADPAFREAGTEGRGRIVSAWVSKIARGLRELGADELDALLEEQR